MPIKQEGAVAVATINGNPSPTSSIATMPFKQEDAVAVATNDGTPSPPSSITTMPIKLEDAESKSNDDDDGTPAPPSYIATMPVKQEDDVASIDDGARFDDAKLPEAEPTIDDDTIIAATTPSPASSASEKRSVQASEATSKRAKLVENSNAAAKGCEPDGHILHMINLLELMEMGIVFSDRESIVKACITAIKELNLAAMNILIPLMDMGYFATIHKIDSDLITEVNVLEEQVEELQDELRRSDDLMERNENTILKELIRVGNCRLDIAHSRMALCHILYQNRLAPEE